MGGEIEQKAPWSKAFAAWADRRVVSMLFLGFSAGIPLLLIFSTLSVWLSEAGTSRSEVTFFSWAALGFSFKFVWAPLVDLMDYFAEAPVPSGHRLMLAPGAELRLADLAPPTGPVTLLAGPEGGFEEDELAAARLTGFQAVRLGPRVLRTETAGMAALAAMMAVWGDY